MKQRKIGISLSYLNIIIQGILGFLYVPILLYYIGKNEYGLYQLIGSLIAYFSIMDFGLTAAVTRFYTKYKALKDQIGMENILAISFYGYSIVTILCLVVGSICYFNLAWIFESSMNLEELLEARQMFLLLLFNITVGMSTMIFRAVINAHERFLFLKGLETVQLFLQPIVVVLILQQYPTAMSVAIGQTILNVVIIIIRGYYCFKYLHIRIKFHYWNRTLFHDFQRLASSVFIVSLVDQVFWKTNQIILGIVQGTGAVAIYSIASLIYMNYMAVSVAISGVYLPHVTELVAKGRPIQELSDLFIQIGRWQYYLLALVATGFIIFGKQFIHMWAGSEFSDAYVITLLIIIPFTIDLIQNIGISILQALNCYGFRAKVYFFTGVVNLLLAIPLGVKYGGIGCAFATGLSLFFGNGIVMNWFYKTCINLDIKAFWMAIGKITLVIIGCLGIGYVIYYGIPLEGKFGFIIKIVVYTLIYFSLIYKFAMNDDEKMKIAATINRGALSNR